MSHHCIQGMQFKCDYHQLWFQAWQKHKALKAWSVLCTYEYVYVHVRVKYFVLQNEKSIQQMQGMFYYAHANNAHVL